MDASRPCIYAQETSCGLASKGWENNGRRSWSEPELVSAIVDALTEVVGADSVLTRAEDLVPYSFDGTAALKQRPSAVVFPRTTTQVADCVRLAAANGTP